MTEGYDTIKVYELNNDIRTASSPRNFALEKSHGRYLFFLDSDDHMTPECIEKVTEKMEETGAQICKFRAEKEFEDDKVLDTYDPRVRFDQAKEVIEYRKDTVPVFTYVRRYYDVCSAGSTELSLNDFEKVIPELEREAGIDIRDYCIEADKELNAFHLMIELSPVETLRPDTGDPDTQQLSEAAEQLFCSQSDSYAEARKTGAIAPVHVSLLEPETQLLYRDKCAVSQKCSEAQLKPVRILDTMEKSKFFHAFIVK